MIKDRKVRICLVGAGRMANSVHYPSLASFDDVEIVGVIETRKDRLDETCNAHGIPEKARFLAVLDTDYQTILRDLAPDGVYVIGQPEIMYPIWHWCLANGFNLYVEKPMGLTAHQAQALAYLADSKGLITQVSHQRRSAPIMRQVRERLLQRGPVIQAAVEFFKCDVSPMLIARDRMMDDGTHAIDTARWICGGEVVDVQSRCRRIGVPDINFITATLHFDNGAVCNVVCNWASGRRVFRTQIHVRGGYADIELEAEARIYLDNDYAGERLTTQEAAGSDKNFVFGGFQAKNREFIDSLKSGVDTCSSPFRDTVKTMLVCQTILAQAQAAGV
ncbi:Gfo/Idh/MocA family oxidoreductase [Alsobacter sp. SYSU M60028]|uniref:Gfo/Idh/MocA family oxidoreductase n=1 Tax=Alsobacter ponti TaxID=2962936 RepID=A0ABT1L7F5_9HYPH|nr:Gfo/Idh/MocA family oxidoreductase [Alsobacter ponti]MCP8937410.1 Gfo/Idh/MocA family oxidoreductase [Alsobacter ponti]